MAYKCNLLSLLLNFLNLLLGLVVGWLGNVVVVVGTENQKSEMAPTHLDTKLVFRCPAINSVVLHLYEK